MPVRIRAGLVSLSIAAFLWVGPVSRASAQCALCRTALESSAEGQAMAAGFNQAILFLLAAPLLLIGSGAFVFWRAARRGSRRPVRSPGQVPTLG